MATYTSMSSVISAKENGISWTQLRWHKLKIDSPFFQHPFIKLFAECAFVWYPFLCYVARKCNLLQSIWVHQCLLQHRLHCALLTRRRINHDYTPTKLRSRDAYRKIEKECHFSPWTIVYNILRSLILGYALDERPRIWGIFELDFVNMLLVAVQWRWKPLHRTS